MEGKQPTRWMVAVDGSEPSRRGFFDVLLRVKNAKEKFQLFVIHIIQLAPLEPSGLDWNLAPLFVEELLWHKREKEFAARDFLNQLTTQLELEEIPYTPILLRARDARTAIIEEIKKRKIDLLTVGRRGENSYVPVGHLLGSFSSYCVEQAPCSVHVVR